MIREALRRVWDHEPPTWAEWWREKKAMLRRWWINPAPHPSQIGKIAKPEKHRPIPMQLGFSLHADGTVYKRFRDKRGEKRLRGESFALKSLRKRVDQSPDDVMISVPVLTLRQALEANDQGLIELVHEEYRQLVEVAKKEMADAGKLRKKLFSRPRRSA